MTWEWVALILGIVLLVVSLLVFVAWTNMKVKMFEAYPKTLPDMLRSTKRDDEAETQIQ